MEKLTTFPTLGWAVAHVTCTSFPKTLWLLAVFTINIGAYCLETMGGEVVKLKQFSMEMYLL